LALEILVIDPWSRAVGRNTTKNIVNTRLVTVTVADEGSDDSHTYSGDVLQRESIVYCLDDGASVLVAKLD
jgi:hypothetical protein